MKKLLTIIGLAAASLAGVHAQVNYTSGNYSQNFDTLATSGTTNTWTDNVTLLGWYAAGLTNGDYTGGDGSSSTGDLYSFGTGTSTERALGSVASGTTGTLNYGLRLTNGNAFTLTQFTLTYDGEQWRRGNNNPQLNNTLSFSYQIFNAGGGSITAASGWTTVSALDFTSPNTSLTTASALDGNAAGNRTVGITATVSSISWGAGQELWLRWSDPNDTGTDHGLAIDNVSFSAIPEPSAMALLGAAALGAAVIFRRRKLNS